MPEPLVSVLVPVLNVATLLPRCLVQAISQAHRGVGPARNAALSLAKGEFVAMVDADDWVEPDFLTETVRLRARGPLLARFARHLRLLAGRS